MSGVNLPPMPDAPAGRTKMRDAYKEAAADLADQALRRQFDNEVCDAEALAWLDTRIAEAWLVRETGMRTPQSVLHDLVDRLTDGEAYMLIRALLNQDGPAPLTELSRAFHEQVAHDLAYEANVIVMNHEPADDDGGVWDDPVRGDRRALAREWTAAGRIGREEQFDV